MFSDVLLFIVQEMLFSVVVHLFRPRDDERKYRHDEEKWCVLLLLRTGIKVKRKYTKWVWRHLSFRVLNKERSVDRRKREKVLYLTRERERKNVPYRREKYIEHFVDRRERKKNKVLYLKRER